MSSLFFGLTVSPDKASASNEVYTIFSNPSMLDVVHYKRKKVNGLNVYAFIITHIF